MTSVNAAHQTPPTPATPRLAHLRRAAALDLFRTCGLGPPPRLLRRFVDTDNDIGGQVMRFLRMIGHDAPTVDGPLLALARVEARTALLPMDTVAEIERDLLSGDPRRFAAAVARSEQSPPPAWPWPIAPAAGADRFVIEDAVDAAREHDRLRDALAASWPNESLADARTDRLRLLLIAGEEAEQALVGALSAGGDAAAPLAELERINAQLATLADAVRAGSPPPACDPPDQTQDVESARLIAHIAAAPDRASALGQWAAFRCRHHPDRPGLSAAGRRAAERSSVLADRALDRLERSGRLGIGAAA